MIQKVVVASILQKLHSQADAQLTLPILFKKNNEHLILSVSLAPLLSGKL